MSAGVKAHKLLLAQVAPRSQRSDRAAGTHSGARGSSHSQQRTRSGMNKAPAQSVQGADQRSAAKGLTLPAPLSFADTERRRFSSHATPGTPAMRSSDGTQDLPDLLVSCSCTLSIDSPRLHPVRQQSLDDSESRSRSKGVIEAGLQQAKVPMRVFGSFRSHASVDCKLVSGPDLGTWVAGGIPLARIRTHFGWLTPRRYCRVSSC